MLVEIYKAVGKCELCEEQLCDGSAYSVRFIWGIPCRQLDLQICGRCGRTIKALARRFEWTVANHSSNEQGESG